MKNIAASILLALGLLASEAVAAQGFVPVRNLNTDSTYTTISDAVNDAVAGDTLLLAATTFTEHVDLSLPITLRGSATGGTLIDVTQDIGWGITLGSDDVTLENVTVLAGGDNPHFAIHSEPGITGISIEHVEVYDSHRSCIDLNGLTGPDLNVVRDVKVVGSAVGFGVALSTCDMVLLEDVYSRDNGFGDIAIMNSNYYDQEISSITIAGDLDLGGPESLGGGGIVVQVDATTLPLGIGPLFPLNIQADGFEQVLEAPGDQTGCIVVHNDDVRQIAATLGANISDLISYDLVTQDAMVYPGMRIQPALDAAVDGDVIHVEAGSYDTIPLVVDAGVSLLGANAGIPADSAALRAEETIIVGAVVTGGTPVMDGLRVATADGAAIEVGADATGLDVRNSILIGEDSPTSTGMVARGLVQSEDNRISRFGEGVRLVAGELNLVRNHIKANASGLKLEASTTVQAHVSSSRFENPGGRGVQVSQAPSASVVDITGSEFNLHSRGIELSTEVNMDLQGNTFLDSEVQVEGATREDNIAYCGANTFEPSLRIQGCMDVNAANFEGCATVNSGCEYPGCTSPKACNYDAGANVDDGTCDFISCAGCPLGFACNYDPDADLYKVEACDFGGCDGEGMAEAGVDRAGLMLTEGCTIPQACNYDPDATIYDNSCTFDCFGCMDSEACNFDAAFTQPSNETCLFKADLYPSAFVDCDGVCYNDANSNGVCDEEEVIGCTDFEACNFNAEATLDDGNCDFISCAGCVNASACNYDETALIPDDSCDYNSCKGCTSPEACNTTLDATIDDGSCTFPVDLYNKTYVDCDGACLNDVNANGVCDEVEIPGCIDLGACNFDEDATMDDGSCEYSSCAGCMDPAFCNYDPGALIDDGNCQDPGDLFPESIVDGVSVVDCVGRCLNDADNDGVCDEQEIPGCQDETACNFNAEATDPGDCTYAEPEYDCDGNCLVDTDGDGVCDAFEVTGCQDEAACNFNADATDPGVCTYAEAEYDCDGNCLVDTDGDGICDAFELPCPGDTNEDGVRGAADILILLSGFGCYENCGAADLDQDGMVGASDILEALQTFGVPCPN